MIIARLLSPETVVGFAQPLYSGLGADILNSRLPTMVAKPGK
jgi:hypothetical protein